MSTEESLQVVKNGFAAFSRGDMPSLLDLMAEDVEWHIPGAGLPLAGTYRGRDGVANFFQKAERRHGKFWIFNLANSSPTATVCWWLARNARG